MTVIWLIVWLIQGTPNIEWFNGGWNDWGIALAICLALDIFGGGGSASRR